MIIKLKSKLILKKMIDLGFKKGELASKIGISYNTFRLLISSSNISNSQIGTVFALADELGYNSIYEIIDIEKTTNIDTNSQIELKKIINKWAND